MRYTHSEKMEIIHMVEESSLGITRTLRELDIARSSFYEWYRRYQENGYNGLVLKYKNSRQVWNTIPKWEKEKVVEVAWQLCRTMKAEDVKETLDMAIEQTGVEHVHVMQRPRLLSDNGPCYISRELKNYLEKQDIRHIRTKVYHPMTQGKIERYHRSMKNLILLDHYYSPTELTKRIREWVDYYNNDRYHEAIDNVTPADKYYGRDLDVLKNREKVRKQTMKLRRKLNRMAVLQTLPNGVS